MATRDALAAASVVPVVTRLAPRDGWIMDIRLVLGFVGEIVFWAAASHPAHPARRLSAGRP